MRFAIITDIHFGPAFYFRGVLRKINWDAKRFLDEFVHEINSSVMPQFVMVLGDLVEDNTASNDRENISYIVRSLSRLHCPVHYAAGNHDLRNVSVRDLTRLFHLKRLYYSFDSDRYRFIVLFPDIIDEFKKIIISDKQKAYLEAELKRAKKECVIFFHYGLADQELKGNPWFEGAPQMCLIGNRREIREILHRSGKVIAVFNSHLHWDRMDVHDGIPYFTIQSLTENEGDRGIASEAHAVVDISDGRIDVDIKGNYPKRFSYKLKRIENYL